MMSLPPFPDQNRPDRAVVAVTGDGALPWLHNLLTSDVSSLVPGSACYGALLSPQGKILHDVFVFKAGTRILIDCAAEQRTALVQKLVLYRLRAKLVIEIDNDLEVGVHMNAPECQWRFQDPRNNLMGWRSFVEPGSHINSPANRKYDERRIELGLADSVGDIGSDKHFPHEANFDQLKAVDFKKGCYVGQEVVSRMQHRGTARSRMLPVTADHEISSGAQITSDGKVIGTVFSCAGLHALAHLRLDRLAEATAPLMAGPNRIHVNVPDWIRYDVTIPAVAA